MDFILHVYCGLYCGACPNLLHTRAGAGTERCYGCKSEHPTAYYATCGIKACATEKGFEFCNECSEIGICEKIRKFVEDRKWLYQLLKQGDQSQIVSLASSLGLTRFTPPSFNVSLPSYRY